MSVEYFTFDLEDSRAGLVRRIRDDEARTLTLEGVQGGKWVDDPTLIRFFANFGGDELDLIQLTVDEARVVADRLGVAL